MIFRFEIKQKLWRKMDNSVEINSEDEKRGENNDQIANLWIPLILRPEVSADSLGIIAKNCT